MSNTHNRSGGGGGETTFFLFLFVLLSSFFFFFFLMRFLAYTYLGQFKAWLGCRARQCPGNLES